MRIERVGPYEIEGELGRGAMGVVLRARDPLGGRAVAIKLLHVTGERAVKRFAREAEAFGRLRHPGIVAAHSAGEHAGRPYLVMDFVEGESLDERLGRSGPLPPREAAKLIRDLALALQHAHETSILHRDIKPANVLLDVSGEPRLTDFGLARDVTAPRSSLTKTGVFMGTPGFWAPEQARGEHEGVGVTTDVYSLGATLYAALTGGPPVTGVTLREVLVATSARVPARPSAEVAGVPKALDAIALRCLAKAQEDRYPSAAALAADLTRFLEGARVDALSDLSLSRSARRRATGALGVAAGGVLVWLVAIGFTARSGQSHAAALERYARYHERILAPYALGVGGGAAPDASALRDLREQVRAGLKAAKGEQEVPELTRALEALQAHERLLTGSPRGEVSRGAYSNLVSAILLSEDGEFSRAKGHLRRAAKDPEAQRLVSQVWARLWSRALAAGGWRQGRVCLAELDSLSDGQRAAPEVVETARLAAGLWLRGRFDEALSSGPRAFAEDFGGFVEEAAQWFPDETTQREAIASARRAAADSPAVEERVAELKQLGPAQARHGVRELMQCVGVLTRAEPPIESTALRRVVDAGMSKVQAGVIRMQDGDWALLLESAAFYEADHISRTGPEFLLYLDLRSNSGEVPPAITLDLLPAYFRFGILDQAREVLPKVVGTRFRDEARRAVDLLPERSQVRRHIEFGLLVLDAGNHGDQEPALGQIVTFGERIFAHDVLSDLHPQYAAIAHCEIAERWAIRAVQSSRAAASSLAASVAHYRSSVAVSNTDARVHFRGRRGVSETLAQLGRIDEAVAYQVETIATFRERAGAVEREEVPPVDTVRDEREALAKALIRRASPALTPIPPLDERLAQLHEAEAILQEVAPASDARVKGRVSLAGILREQGKLDEAERALSPFVDRINQTQGLALEAIRVSLAQRRFDEARRRYAAGLRGRRPRPWVDAVKKLFADAGVSVE